MMQEKSVDPDQLASEARPCGYITFFMLNPTEHKVDNAHKC